MAVVYLSGCASQAVNKETGEPLTKVEKASVIADELTKHYRFLHTNVEEILYGDYSREDKQWIVENVSGEMNRAKKLIKTYNQTIVLWRETGQMPDDIYEKERVIRSILEGVVVAFMKDIKNP